MYVCMFCNHAYMCIIHIYIYIYILYTHTHIRQCYMVTALMF